MATYNVTPDTTDEQYLNNVITMDAGDIIIHEGVPFETVCSIVDYLSDEAMELEPIQPGTPLYITYGANAIIVKTAA